MSRTLRLRSAIGLVAAGLGLATTGYALCAAVSWRRFGRASKPTEAERDTMLDRFMPAYHIVERHGIRIAAQAGVTFATACEQDLLQMPLVRVIFKIREVVMGTSRDERLQPRGLLASTQAIGWGVLAELPGREIVMGAVTRPWEAEVTFHALAPEEFAAFSQPGFVKIAWTLRADPIDGETSFFRTETRALATDEVARARFKRYWTLVAPGVTLIRRLSLQPLRRAAERQARAARAADQERQGKHVDFCAG